MPRRPRVHLPGGFYHVTLRGNHRLPIFGCVADRTVLDAIVGDASKALGVEIHAYCWMTNHVHLVVRVGAQPLGRFMHRLATRYARYFQKSQETTGHLFERRYHAVLVTSDPQLLVSVRYVHLNPVRASLVSDAADYAWSGHRAYAGFGGPSWLVTSFVLGMLGEAKLGTHDAYLRFVAAAEASSVSLGADRPQCALVAANCQAEPALSAAPSVAARRQPESLEELITRICTDEQVSVSDLGSNSRSRRLVHARARIVEASRNAGLATPSQLARRFNRHVATLCKSVARRPGLK